jgi:hypothetical protein
MKQAVSLVFKTRSTLIATYLCVSSLKDWKRGDFLQDLSYYAPNLNIRKTDGFYHETDK